MGCIQQQNEARITSTLYRAFHNIRRDYKNLLYETRRTRIFFFGGMTKTGIRPTIAT